MNEKILWTISVIAFLLLILDDFQIDLNFAIVERKPFLNIITLNSNG